MRLKPAYMRRESDNSASAATGLFCLVSIEFLFVAGETSTGFMIREHLRDIAGAANSLLGDRKRR